MNWENVLCISFCAIGFIQYVKGLVPSAPTWVWAALQPFLCIVLGVAFNCLPLWFQQGVVGFALSQIGYETIIQQIKSRISKNSAI